MTERKTILFVDDEVGILDGLRRMLHSARSEWDMTFLESGAEAIAAFEKSPFDIIVTDMRMPHMSGAQLLGEIHRRWPRTVRIVLTGYADLESSMRAVLVSHQFLAKPCSAEDLTDVIRKACGIDELLNDERVRNAIGRIAQLPVMPQVYNDLTLALANEEVEIDEVARILEGDAALVLRVLQLVNSSYFGLRREVSSVKEATVHLGVNTLRDLVLSFEVFKRYERLDTDLVCARRLQRHSLAAAQIARRICRDAKDSEQAFLAAMLHDVGKLVLAESLPDLFLDVIERGAGVTRSFNRVESEVTTVGHAEIGAYLLALWGMPYPVIEAVAFHHAPSKVRGRPRLGPLAATHIADALAVEAAGDPGGLAELDREYVEAVGATERIDEWLEIAKEEISNAMEFAR